jgi:hypothetical protein
MKMDVSEELNHDYINFAPISIRTGANPLIESKGKVQ